MRVAAADEPFALVWQAPEGCPSQAQVEEEIRSALSHLRGKGAVEVNAEVTLRAEEPGFQLRVKVTHAGQIGERLLPIDDCDDASRAAALLVALSVENPPPPRWSIGLGPRLVLGIAPELAAGVGLSAAYSRSFWRISARGAAFAPSHHTVPNTQVGGTFNLYTVGLFACAGYPGSPLTFYGCLGGRYDHLKGSSFGATTNSNASTQIGSVDAGITLEWSLTPRFTLRTELEAGYPFGDAKFVIQNVPTPVHEVDSLRGEAALELAVVF